MKERYNCNDYTLYDDIKIVIILCLVRLVTVNDILKNCFFEEWQLY